MTLHVSFSGETVNFGLQSLEERVVSLRGPLLSGIVSSGMHPAHKIRACLEVGDLLDQWLARLSDCDGIAVDRELKQLERICSL